MLGQNYEKQKPGKSIAARTLNRPSSGIERLSRLRTGNGLEQKSIGGIPELRSTARPSQMARLIASAGAGAYTWQGIYGLPDGGWADLDASVSDAGSLDLAYELNGNTLLKAGTRVELEREPYTGEWRFQLDQCSTVRPASPEPVPPPAVIVAAKIVSPVQAGMVAVEAAGIIGPPPFLLPNPPPP